MVFLGNENNFSRPCAVFHIMVNVCNGQGWKEALLEVLPARKGAKEKGADDDYEEDDEDAAVE